ncbi:ubiquitin conjugating enzyme E2 R1 [Trichuris trichiura]|uniref:Ubiquitin conjugating enzyme E2 R1 n=1 Tax=Trichuris trichiura TaxID=36087 RepID=A0A077YYV0_TRITR|nr:ubiquitin conjugating enzyme E2 R1 [Trichuris trichiura]
MSVHMAKRLLAREMKSLTEEPMEGFRVKLINEEDLFEWEVALFGPPATIYEGGYLKAILQFPMNYPFSPPTMRFITRLWHPNIYESGEVCISILHAPVEDTQSGELACERWNPAQTVRTILLSVISLLNEPNTSSPANVEASVMYRRYMEGVDDEYAKVVRRIVQMTAEDAARDGVVVPTTVDDYCVKTIMEKPGDADGQRYEMEFHFWRNDECSENEEEDEEDGSGQSAEKEGENGEEEERVNVSE